LYVLPAGGAIGSGGVRGREVVHEAHLGPAGQHARHVQHRLPVDGEGGHSLQPRLHLLGAGAALRIGEPDDDVGAALRAPAAFVEHGVGLARTGGDAEVDAPRPASHAPSIPHP